MAKLGAPATTKFQIGTAEVRVGPLDSALRLTQAHSIGLIDNVTVEIAQDSVDLEGGFPRSPVDTAIVRRNGTVTATLREYSRRNIKLMMGEGVISGAEPVDESTLIVTNLAAAGASFDVSGGDGTMFVTGDLWVIYPAGRPEEITVVRVLSVATDTVTLDADTPALHNYDGTSETINIYHSRSVGIGAVQTTNYFAVEVLQVERKTGRPVGFQIWKATTASGMTLGSNAEDFASNDLALKVLEPAASDYAAGGDLVHLDDIIPLHPQGLMFYGADNA